MTHFTLYTLNKDQVPFLVRITRENQSYSRFSLLFMNFKASQTKLCVVTTTDTKLNSGLLSAYTHCRINKYKVYLHIRDQLFTNLLKCLNFC